MKFSKFSSFLALLALCAVLTIPAHSAPPSAAAPTPIIVSAPHAEISAPSAEPSNPLVGAGLSGLAAFFFLGSVRSLVDAQLVKTVNLPAAGASAHTAAIDIGTGPHVSRLEIRVETEAVPALVDAKTLTITLEDSADGVTFATLAEIPAVVKTGAGGVGAAATLNEYRLPPDCRSYIRAAAAVLAAGGDNTAKKLTLTVLV